MHMLNRLALVAVAVVSSAIPAAAQVAGASANDVATQLSNPVANLTSIPFQFNWQEGVGPYQDLRFVLNIQPVVPFTVNPDWNLVMRFILPYVGQPALVTGGQPTSGTGDIVTSAFFSPTHSQGATLGFGPVFQLPTTTDPFLGSGQWAAGPTVLVLKQQNGWTYGVLANQLWSFARTGNYERTDVNQTFVQPFLAHAKNGTTLGVSAEASGNWEAPSGDEWTIPLFVNWSKVESLGPFPFSVGASLGAYVASPDNGPDWVLRTVFTVVLPSKK